MRWLLVHPGPGFSVADVHIGWLEALTGLGEQVRDYNLGERLTFFERARFEREPGLYSRALTTNEDIVRLAVDGLYADLFRARPDVLLVISALFIPHELLDRARASGSLVVVIHTEAPYENDRQIKLAEHADLNLVNDPTNLDAFPRALYLPHAYRPAVHHPGPGDPDLKCDLAFVGTGYRSRIQFLEAMDLDGLDVTLAGNWQHLDEVSPLRRYVAHDPAHCFDNADTARLYRSARVGLNLYRREANLPELAQGVAIGPREVEMAACRLPFVRDPRPESDDLFPMLPAASSPDEASERIRWLLAHDTIAAQLADHAYAVIADRTFSNHAAILLRLLDRIDRRRTQ